MDRFAAENLVCQLVAWPFVTSSCTWAQWTPALAGYLAAFAFRAKGTNRLATFVGGAATFYFFAIALALTTPLQTSEEQLGWVFYAGLFLVPVAAVLSLSGLICGDLYRYCRARSLRRKA